MNIGVDDMGSSTEDLNRWGGQTRHRVRGEACTGSQRYTRTNEILEVTDNKSSPTVSRSVRTTIKNGQLNKYKYR